ncbi:hypothetical protein [Stenotrophomonas sp. 22385]|uniref:hypothetical protein n=1 Tax=Stenotrophomonas sp. 22385 TaxID=3453915 RepID=UPI003F86FCD2
MSTWNWAARMIAVPLSTAVAGSVVFLAPSLHAGNVPLDDALRVLPLFAIIGAVIGLIVGCPLVCLIDGMFERWRLRYLIFGAVGAVLGWLLMEGAFASGSWDAIWSSRTFWMTWAPRRILVFSIIGLMSGLLYMGLVSLIDHAIPRERW